MPDECRCHHSRTRGATGCRRGDDCARRPRPPGPSAWPSRPAGACSVSRLYPTGVRRQEIARWWDNSERRHGTHGLMYDFARDAAGVAPLGSALPALVRYAQVEEFRYAVDGARGQHTAVGLGRHRGHDGHMVQGPAVTAVTPRPVPFAGPGSPRGGAVRNRGRPWPSLVPTHSTNNGMRSKAGGRPWPCRGKVRPPAAPGPASPRSPARRGARRSSRRPSGRCSRRGVRRSAASGWPRTAA